MRTIKVTVHHIFDRDLSYDFSTEVFLEDDKDAFIEGYSAHMVLSNILAGIGEAASDRNAQQEEE